MTLTLNLSPELEQYLEQEAHQQGLSVETLALQLLTNSLLPKQKQAQAVNSNAANFLLAIAGLGKSDQENISECDEEILRNEIHAVYGWNLKPSDSE